MALDVLGVGGLYLAIAVLAYALTRSGVRITFWVPLSVPSEVLLGLAALVLSALALLCGALAVLLGALGLSDLAQWAVALGLTLVVAVPLVRRTWAVIDAQVRLVQAKRDARAGLPPRSGQMVVGRHEK